MILMLVARVSKLFTALLENPNYLHGLTKLLSTLYPAKFLNILVKVFFPCNTLIWIKKRGGTNEGIDEWCVVKLQCKQSPLFGWRNKLPFYFAIYDKWKRKTRGTNRKREHVACAWLSRHEYEFKWFEWILIGRQKCQIETRLICSNKTARVVLGLITLHIPTHSSSV